MFFFEREEFGRCTKTSLPNKKLAPEALRVVALETNIFGEKEEQPNSLRNLSKSMQDSIQKTRAGGGRTIVKIKRVRTEVRATNGWGDDRVGEGRDNGFKGEGVERENAREDITKRS